MLKIGAVVCAVDDASFVHESHKIGDLAVVLDVCRGEYWIGFLNDGANIVNKWELVGADSIRAVDIDAVIVNSQFEQDGD